MRNLVLACALLLSAGNAGAAAFTVYAAGDIANCADPDPRWSGAFETGRLVERELAANPDAAVLALGDNVYRGASLQDFIACYGPTWGRFRDRTYPAPGNHEYRTPGARGYFDYFGKPAWYSVQLGAWRVISLDSNLAGAAREAQLAWLRQELDTRPARCTLAYWHHPLYSSGGHGSISVMRDAWELLHRAGAEIVLSGHDHDYERFAPQDAHGRLDAAGGIRQFVVGTGGAFYTPFRWPLQHSEMRDNSRMGVLKLVLGESGYSWEFLEASYDGFPNGQPPDRGSGQCH
ncbi:MAG: metallophosphoesterase [Pseudomonadota bacterium]